MLIIKNDPNIKKAFEKEEEKPQSNEVNENMNLEGAEIETVQERQDDYNEGRYNKKGKYYKNSDNNYYNNDKYDNYKYKNDKYDNYNDNKNYKYKGKNYKNYNGYDGYDYDYNDYGGKKNYKGGYNDYDYGKSYKKKNYYKGGYK